MNDGWRSSGISISWATKNVELEERDTLYEDRAWQKALFVVKGGRSKDAAVAGLLSKTDSSKKKQQDEEARDEDELDGRNLSFLTTSRVALMLQYIRRVMVVLQRYRFTSDWYY